jgi:DNA-binding response OmpR family regulator
MPAIHVGLLEDEAPQAEMLLGWLQEAEYKCFHCSSGQEFLEHVRLQHPDMLILDWQLPDMEGIDVLSHIRNELEFTGPVLFATGRDHEEDIVRGLTSGADDYLIKPLRRAELLARLGALWRRSGLTVADQITLGPVRLDLDNKQAWVDGEEIKLTPTEFSLAACVFTHRGELLSREFLLKEVWGVDADLDTRTVDMHMSRIRRLLKIDPNMGYCIKTIYRHGYRLEEL